LLASAGRAMLVAWRFDYPGTKNSEFLNSMRCSTRQKRRARAQRRHHRRCGRRYSISGAHNAACLITGETLYIDGGYHIID
jgi:hypothetical protein